MVTRPACRKLKRGKLDVTGGRSVRANAGGATRCARMEKRRVIIFIRAFEFGPNTWYTTSSTGPGELDTMNGTAVKYLDPFGQVGGERDTLNSTSYRAPSPPAAHSHRNSLHTDTVDSECAIL